MNFMPPAISGHSPRTARESVVRIARTSCIAMIWLAFGPVQASAQGNAAALFEASCGAELKTMQAEWARAGKTGPAVSSRYASVASMDAQTVDASLRFGRSAATPQARATNAWELCLLTTRRRQLAQAQSAHSSRAAALPSPGTGRPQEMSHSDWTATTTRSYKNPQTGEDCVTVTSGPQDSVSYGKLWFQNTCGRVFSVQVRFSDGKTAGTGIGAATNGKPGKLAMMCEKRLGQCDGNITWYER